MGNIPPNKSLELETLTRRTASSTPKIKSGSAVPGLVPRQVITTLHCLFEGAQSPKLKSQAPPGTKGGCLLEDAGTRVHEPPLGPSGGKASVQACLEPNL